MPLFDKARLISIQRISDKVEFQVLISPYCDVNFVKHPLILNYFNVKNDIVYIKYKKCDEYSMLQKMNIDIDTKNLLLTINKYGVCSYNKSRFCYLNSQANSWYYISVNPDTGIIYLGVDSLNSTIINKYRNSNTVIYKKYRKNSNLFNETRYLISCLD